MPRLTRCSGADKFKGRRIVAVNSFVVNRCPSTDGTGLGSPCDYVRLPLPLGPLEALKADGTAQSGVRSLLVRCSIDFSVCSWADVASASVHGGARRRDASVALCGAGGGEGLDSQRLRRGRDRGSLPCAMAAIQGTLSRRGTSRRLGQLPWPGGAQRRDGGVNVAVQSRAEPCSDTRATAVRALATDCCDVWVTGRKTQLKWECGSCPCNSV